MLTHVERGQRFPCSKHFIFEFLDVELPAIDGSNDLVGMFQCIWPVKPLPSWAMITESEQLESRVTLLVKTGSNFVVDRLADLQK